MELSKVQQEAVDFYEGCCNVIASAGSGKTRVLVNRIVKLIEDYDVEPGKILAITFSKKAKENMVERLTKMIPGYVKFINVETFHSFGFRIVRKFNREDFEILDADWKKVKIIEEILQHYFREKEPDGQEIADILSYISIQKNQMKKPDKNVRMHTEKQLQEYERSVRMFGQIRPIVVDEGGTILAGIGLYDTMLRMGEKEADVYQLKSLTPTQKKKLMIADNKIFNLGVENLEVLNEFFEELKDDLDIPGFDEDILRQMVSDAEEVTEKICEYGTLDDDEIKQMKQLEERQKAAYGNSVSDQNEPAPTEGRVIQEPQTNEKAAEPEGNFVICPDCGRKIWL